MNRKHRARSPRATRKPTPAAGFSLVEVLVALVIISFMMVEVANLYMLSLFQQRNARFLSSMIRVGQQKIEQFRTEGLPGSNGTEIIKLSEQDVPHLGGQPVVQVRWEVQNNSPVPNLTTVRITVTAGYESGSGFKKIERIRPNPVELLTIF